MKQLKTLDEHNAGALEGKTNWTIGTPVKNGIACPNCGAELFDSMPNIVIDLGRGKKYVHCGNCKFTGHRNA